MKELSWIKTARSYIGLREIRGTRHNQKIINWIKQLGGWFKDDETPWCGTFVAHCLTVNKRAIPRHWYRAKAYAKYGTRLNKPAYGSIGVMSRRGGGHVTFIVGQTQDGRYLVGLGGNQSNMVNLALFPRSRFTHFIWPELGNGVPSLPYNSRYDLPIYNSNLQARDLKVSTNEA